MLTKTIIGAAIAGIALIASPAMAQYPRNDHRGYTGNWNSGDQGVAPNGSGGGGAFWSYCPPKTVPQTFPNGNGYRCVDPNYP